MYINKKLYYVIKSIYLIGIYFWGMLEVSLVVGVCLDVVQGENGYMQAGIPIYIIIFGVLFAAHIPVNAMLQSTRIFSGIFSNNAAGILQPKVIAKALGLDEKKVITDFRLLCKSKLLLNCRLQTVDGMDMIVLADTEGKFHLRKVICPHCGGENYVHRGFVQCCKYCSGNLEGK